MITGAPSRLGRDPKRSAHLGRLYSRFADKVAVAMTVDEARGLGMIEVTEELPSRLVDNMIFVLRELARFPQDRKAGLVTLNGARHVQIWALPPPPLPASRRLNHAEVLA